MRGYIFMLEAAFASIIVVGFVLYLGHLSNISGPTSELRFDSEIDELYLNGKLSEYASSGDVESLEQEIQVLGYNHSVQICDQSGDCIGSAPDEDEVFVSSFYLAGYDSYDPKEVRLYVWKM
jgi:hypothetical protein